MSMFLMRYRSFNHLIFKESNLSAAEHKLVLLSGTKWTQMIRGKTPEQSLFSNSFLCAFSKGARDFEEHLNKVEENKEEEEEQKDQDDELNLESSNPKMLRKK
ncbi:hypothetical protein Csa_011068 [Cucumis sativus]|nr:hypothetical protein Csa_011068 [Cucumis sativus]